MSGQDPEQAANEILEAVWRRSGDDLAIPVDPIHIARQLGIEVYTANLDEEVSGMLVKRPGVDPKIYLQSSDSRNRRRFTCAHELGHYVSRSANADDEEWEYVEHRALLASQGTNADEIFANKFAANLLMPQRAVKKLKDRFGSPAALAFEFGVSADAMNFRLVNLGLN